MGYSYTEGTLVVVYTLLTHVVFHIRRIHLRYTNHIAGIHARIHPFSH